MPHVYNHTTWQYKSKVMIFNPGPATAEVTITYRHPNGTLVLTDGPFAVPPFAAVGKEPPGTTFYGSAHIAANTQPVAVVADHFHNNATVNFNYNALNNGFSTIYLPYLMKNYGGWNSCFVVRDLSGSTNNIQITYYWEGGSGTYLASVPGHGTQTFCQQDLSGLPSGRVLSAQVVSTNGRNIAAAVNQSNNSAGSDQGWHMSYSGFTQPSKKVILPHLMKNASSSGRSWNSGLQIQNTDSGSTTATITYYNDSGQAVYSQPIAIPAGQSRGVYLPEVSGLPNPFKGSAVVTAGRNLVAVANATCTSGCNGGDYVYTYNGFNR